MESPNSPAEDKSGQRCLSISSLNPYVHRWALKGRIVERSPMNTTRGNAKFFHVDIKDNAGDVIRAKFWNDAADKWYSIIEEGKVYSFSRGKINVANKRFSTLACNYELTFFQESEIHIANDDGTILNQKSVSIMPLRSIATTTRECPFPTDIRVTVVEVQPISTVLSKTNGEQMKRRIVKVRDETQMEMDLTLWGNEVDAFTDNHKVPDSCVITHVLVRDWKGSKSASSSRDTRILHSGKGLLPQSEEKAVQELSEWYKTNGTSVTFANISRSASGDGTTQSISKPIEISIEEIKARQEGIYTFYGSIRRIYWKQRSNTGNSNETQEALMYAACPSCKKKLVQDSSGDFGCYSCSLENATPDWRYMFLASFVDPTGSLVCRCFAEHGSTLLGTAASEVRSWDQDIKTNFLEWDSLMNKCFRVVIRAEMTQYNGEQRLRYTAISIEAVDYYTLSQKLFTSVCQMLKDDTSRISTKRRNSEALSGDENDDEQLIWKRERRVSAF